MDNNIQHGVLLKFGQKEHLETLLNGQLYLKSIRHFKENGKDSIGRYDKNENLTDVWRQPHFKGKLLFDNIEIATIGNMNIYIPEHDKDLFTHISSFCLPDINFNKRGINKLIDSRMQGFGDYVLLIHNVPKFQKLVIDASYKHPEISKTTMNKVNYVDKENFHGSVNIFSKFNDFDWQQEYRIAIRNLEKFEEDHLFLNIGDISDIAILLKTEDLGFEYYLTIESNVNIYLGTKSVNQYRKMPIQ